MGDEGRLGGHLRLGESISSLEHGEVLEEVAFAWGGKVFQMEADKGRSTRA